ncbi:hypothetical protein IGI04_035713 [Brassica rapa subsp. trilocularis]|uniref:Uncharacterized protein n=1 Tax=Brassica rapa subsp. trilocularis TaxID=1813537 RepID=A0ABQ7LCD2_BRACM|nr:hypothetical protein IGI04_035713 [Brassica rapa subsp. trilocularis]
MEKWEKKKAVTDCEACLREVVANIDLLKEIMNNNLLASDELLRLQPKEAELGSEADVMATSDFSIGKLDLPLISEDLPEDFFAKVPSGMDGSVKCSDDRFEDGGIVDPDFFATPVGGVGRNRGLDQGPGFWSTAKLCDFMIREICCV